MHHRPRLVTDLVYARLAVRRTDNGRAEEVEVVEGRLVVPLDRVCPGGEGPSFELDPLRIPELDRVVVEDACGQDWVSACRRSLHRNRHGSDERAQESSKR